MTISVIIADDHSIKREGLRTLLLREGDFELLGEAEDGRTAVALVKDLRPDVIVMDVVMPGMNGFQATRRLSKNPATAEIPVVIVSGKGQETDRIWGLRQGANQYLVKPVDGAELVNAVEASLNNG